MATECQICCYFSARTRAFRWTIWGRIWNSQPSHLTTGVSSDHSEPKGLEGLSKPGLTLQLLGCGEDWSPKGRHPGTADSRHSPTGEEVCRRWSNQRASVLLPSGSPREPTGFPLPLSRVAGHLQEQRLDLRHNSMWESGV